MVCEYSRSETEKPSGTISSRSRRTSCHPRPYISDLVLRPSKGPVYPPTTLPFPPPFPPSRRYIGSCDPRRGKLSTHPSLRRGKRERVALRAIYVDYSTDKRPSLSPSNSCRRTLLFFFFPFSFSAISYLSERRGKQIMTIAGNISVS